MTSWSWANGCADAGHDDNLTHNPGSTRRLSTGERLKIDVRERIDALAAATMSDRCNAPPELKAKLWTDLVRPNVKILVEFCSNVTFDDAGQDA